MALLNQKKNTSGFTLVEVIVVAVIIAVLSAVAVPLYNGYLRDARRNTAENVAGSAASFIGSHVAMTGLGAGNAITSVQVRVAGAAAAAIADNVWYFSTGAARSVLVGTTMDGQANEFIIPTDIAIRVNLANHRVEACHLAAAPGQNGVPNFDGIDEENDISQPYHYHTGLGVAANP